MERLISKGGEFYLAARHMHARGMSDVVEEAKEIVNELKSSGKTFEDVKSFFDEKNGEPIDIESDLYLKHIKAAFERG